MFSIHIVYTALPGCASFAAFVRLQLLCNPALVCSRALVSWRGPRHLVVLDLSVALRPSSCRKMAGPPFSLAHEQPNREPEHVADVRGDIKPASTDCKPVPPILRKTCVAAAQGFMYTHFTHTPTSGRAYTMLTSAFSHRSLWHLLVSVRRPPLGHEDSCLPELQHERRKRQTPISNMGLPDRGPRSGSQH